MSTFSSYLEPAQLSHMKTCNIVKFVSSISRVNLTVAKTMTYVVSSLWLMTPFEMIAKIAGEYFFSGAHWCNEKWVVDNDLFLYWLASINAYHITREWFSLQQHITQSKTVINIFADLPPATCAWSTSRSPPSSWASPSKRAGQRRACSSVQSVITVSQHKSDYK